MFKNIQSVFVINIKKIIRLKDDPIIFVLSVNAIVFFLLWILGLIQYETVDDYMMFEKLSGYKGEVSSLVVYINQLISSPIAWLFKKAPIINWYSLMLISFSFVAFSIIGIYIQKILKNKYSKIYYLIILIAFCIPSLLQLQYTSVSAILMAAGIIIQTYVLREKKTGPQTALNLLCSAMLIVTGSLLRYNVLYIYYIFLISYLTLSVFTVLVNKNTDIIKSNIKYIIILNIVIFIACFSFVIIDKKTYIAKGMGEYLEYNDLRTKLNDTVMIEYTKNKEIFEKVNWSFNDWMLFKYFNNGDDNVFSKEKLEIVINEFQKKSLSEFDFLYFLNTDSNLQNASFAYLLLILLSLILVIQRKEKWWSLILVLPIIGQILFGAIHKPNFRVIMPLYLFAIILTLRETKYKKKTLNKIILCLFVVAITFHIIFMGSLAYAIRINTEGSYNKLYQYVKQSPENVYIYSTYSLQYRYYSSNIISINKKYLNSQRNILPMGSWLNNDDISTKTKIKYNIENLYKDLIIKDNFFLVDSEQWDLEGTRLKNVLMFLEEHYYQEEIKVKVIKQIDDIYIYQLYID